MRVERLWRGLKGVSADKTNRKEATSKSPTLSKNKTERVRIHPIIKINSFEVTRDATVAAYGIGLLPTYIGEPLVTKGSLAPVLRGWGTVATPINLVMPAHSERSPKVSAFVDFVLENRKEVLGL